LVGWINPLAGFLLPSGNHYLENKNLASIDVTDSARLRGKVDHTTWHACKSRLKLLGLPQTPKRIGFLLWLEHQQHHVFTFEEYVERWGYNNAHLHLNEYEKADLSIIATSIFLAKLPPAPIAHSAVSAASP
jgi:hypothetical protein